MDVKDVDTCKAGQIGPLHLKACFKKIDALESLFSLRYYAAGASGTNLWLLRLRKQKLSDRSAGCFFLAIQWNSRDRPKNRLVENIARRRVLAECSHRTILDGQFEEKWIRQVSENDNGNLQRPSWNKLYQDFKA